MNKAFTLVELAIVIVIIGLLVGGVLQGQELIEQAKLRKTISEMDSFDASIMTFKAKYNAIPGDMLTATRIWGEVSANCTDETGTGTQTCNGNGNNAIDYNTYEDRRIWQHLSNAKLVKGSYTGPFNNRAVLNPKTPYAANWVLWSVPSTSYSWANTINSHIYTFAHQRGNRASSSKPQNSWYQYSLTQEQLQQFDLKLDDGKPYTGRVRNMGNNYTENCASTNVLNQNAVYLLTSNETECIPIFDSKVN